MIAECPELLNRKYNIPIKAIKGDKIRTFSTIRHCLNIVKSANIYATPQEKLDALDLILTAIKDGSSINGWKFEIIKNL